MYSKVEDWLILNLPRQQQMALLAESILPHQLGGCSRSLFEKSFLWFWILLFWPSWIVVHFFKCEISRSKIYDLHLMNFNLTRKFLDRRSNQRCLESERLLNFLEFGSSFTILLDQLLTQLEPVMDSDFLKDRNYLEGANFLALCIVRVHLWLVKKLVHY